LPSTWHAEAERVDENTSFSAMYASLIGNKALVYFLVPSLEIISLSGHQQFDFSSKLSKFLLLVLYTSL
jgi:hypothetical protein